MPVTDIFTTIEETEKVTLNTCGIQDQNHSVYSIRISIEDSSYGFSYHTFYFPSLFSLEKFSADLADGVQSLRDQFSRVTD
jgi:hypothetical protein